MTVTVFPALTTAEFIGLVSWLLIPLASLAVDLVPAFRSDGRRVRHVGADVRPCADFEILVPIYGDLKYLENVEFLAAYGQRVVLCTSLGESQEFDDGLEALRHAHGFRIFRTRVPGRGVSSSQRSVAAPVRDLLVREALATVDATYVVCIDADTVTGRPIDDLVGAFADAEFDLASVRLLPSNADSLLARFQGHEYRMAMRMRRLYPWLVSGACHVARTNVHYQVMRAHSLFFQGNDAELGILADQMGYRVGHLTFDVPTTVPSTFRAWWRQRYAWVGGEFRIFFINLRFASRHRYFYLYGVIVVVLLAPFRWMVVIAHPPVLVVVYVAYLLAFSILNWRTRDWALPLLPLYTLFGSLVLVPMGGLSYLTMAFTHHNFGVIRPRSDADPGEVAAQPVTIPDGIRIPAVSVVDLQGRLRSVGYYDGAVDGCYGPLTRRSLIAWQQHLLARGYDLGEGGADGVYGRRTAVASAREAPWCGVDDTRVSTAEWLRYHASSWSVRDAAAVAA